MEQNLIDLIWTDKPTTQIKPVFYLPERYTGESTPSKLARIRAELESQKVHGCVISALDEVACTSEPEGFHSRD